MIRIAICGITGRMGQTLTELIDSADDLELAGGIAHDAPADATGPVVRMEHAQTVLARADVAIDFSAPAALQALIEQCGERGALVVGTTGLDAQLEARLNALAKRMPVLVAANFSVGVNLLLGLVERAAAALPAERYDVEVVEAHHRRKVDAPSGTALALARAVAAGRAVALEDVRCDGRSGETGVRARGEIGIHALRGGNVVGAHTVHFLGERERIAISHEAQDRSLFAEGALVAARWLHGRAPGRYTMTDVLGI